ncbi:hypothetical protein [Streptomyces sp. NPDC056660]|uniref:hypothetical protein n=1 Tax=Streptomyces sp. NPDC056660 TaxID=3345897 RepID=UPI0036970190
MYTPAERLLWNRLSVFADDFGLDAAEAVCAGDGIGADEVLDLLDQLVDQSLVLSCEREGLPRYRLLQTIRQYGRRRLAESGEEQRILQRHHDFCLALAERVADGWYGPGQLASLTGLRAEHANLRAALVQAATRRPPCRWSPRCASTGARADSSGRGAAGSTGHSPPPPNPPWPGPGRPRSGPRPDRTLNANRRRLCWFPRSQHDLQESTQPLMITWWPLQVQRV